MFGPQLQGDASEVSHGGACRVAAGGDGLRLRGGGPRLGPAGKGVWKCPSNPVANTKLHKYNGDDPNDSKNNWPVSYGANENRGNLAGGPFGDTQSQYTLAQLIAPSSLIAFAETTAVYNDMRVTVGNSCCFNQPNNPDPNADAGNLFAGHGGLSNFLFCDGHVRAMHPLATTNECDPSGCKPTQINMWTNDNSPFTDADNGAFTGAQQTLKFSTNYYN